MNICFITGPFKPNKCGISDYIVLLTNELQDLGHSISRIIIEKPQDFSTTNKKLLNSELISMQYAPYLFSPNGLCGSHLTKFARVLKGKRVHINFHEIWVGAYPTANFIEKFNGFRQKKEIQNFLRLVKPEIITSTNTASLDRLNCSKINAQYLYLCGNIRYSHTDLKNDTKKVKVAVFGTPYTKFPYIILFQRLVEIVNLTGKSVELKILGRQRDDNTLLKIKDLSKKFEILIHECGELPAESISHELQQCDLGICTTPFDVIGKSGAAAAMLEHGLPVLAYDDGDTAKGSLITTDLFQDQIFLINDNYSAENVLKFIDKPRKCFFDGVAHTAKKMLGLVS